MINNDQQKTALEGALGEILDPIFNQYPAFCSGYGQNYTAKYGNKTYLGVTIQAIVRMLDDPQGIDKKLALWSIFSDLQSRVASEQRTNGNFYALWFDIDDGNSSLSALKDF